MIIYEHMLSSYLKSLTEKPGDYAIYSMKHEISRGDQEHFRAAIETLGLIKEMKKANKIGESLGAKEKINIEILYKVIDASLNDEPFSKEDLKAYFENLFKIDKCYSAINELIDYYTYVPTSTEMFLMGYNYREQNLLDDIVIDDENIFEHYSSKLYKYSEGELDYDSFIKAIDDAFMKYKEAYLDQIAALRNENKQLVT